MSRYPMWSPEHTGILLDNDVGGARYVTSGPEYDRAALVAAPWSEPDPEPTTAILPVTRFQGRMVLRRWGLFNQASVAATLAGGDTLHAWNEAIEWRRDSPMIESLGGALGLTSQEIDALFVVARRIRL